MLITPCVVTGSYPNPSYYNYYVSNNVSQAADEANQTPRNEKVTPSQRWTEQLFHHSNFLTKSP